MKFCGMCGSALPAAAEAEEASPRDVPQEAPRISEVEPEPIAERPVTPSPTAAPAYTGGAFRLMGQEVEPGRRSLDYLLEDDEDSRSGVGRWLIALLVALALAGGLGYWRYRNGGWMAKNPAGPAVTQDAGANGSGTNANTVSAPANGSTDNSAASSTPPAAGSPSSAAMSDVRPQNPAPAPSAAPEAPSAAAAAATDQPAAAKPVAPAHAEPAPAKPRATTPRTDAPVKAEDPVSLGEKYIYGRGVPQNCDRGVKLMRPAADAANSKAMITMGALYATGLCVSRDLPTAYKFFALALRKDPENGALKQNVERVWGQMTQLERQEAIRLTQ
jgi:hypothetical protein